MIVGHLWASVLQVAAAREAVEREDLGVVPEVEARVEVETGANVEGAGRDTWRGSAID